MVMQEHVLSIKSCKNMSSLLNLAVISWRSTDKYVFLMLLSFVYPPIVQPSVSSDKASLFIKMLLELEHVSDGQFCSHRASLLNSLYMKYLF